MHVHAASSNGEAKVWLDPRVELADNVGLSTRELTMLCRIVQEHEQEIRDAWHDHFGR